MNRRPAGLRVRDDGLDGAFGGGAASVIGELLAAAVRFEVLLVAPPIALRDDDVMSPPRR